MPDYAELFFAVFLLSLLTWLSQWLSDNMAKNAIFNSQEFLFYPEPFDPSGPPPAPPTIEIAEWSGRETTDSHRQKCEYELRMEQWEAEMELFWRSNHA